MILISGSDLIAWMMRELDLDDQQEALHLANLMASHGYFFPIDDHVLWYIKKRNFCSIRVFTSFFFDFHSSVSKLIIHSIVFKHHIFGLQIVGNLKIPIMRYIFVKEQCRTKLA